MKNFEETVDMECLLDSTLKSKKDVIWKDSVASFYLNDIERCYQLSQELLGDNYYPKPPTTFKITSPKERTIVSIGFRDRVYQRSLNDNILYPTMTKSLIFDNCACQLGKGTDFARDRLKLFLHKLYKEGKAETSYVLQIDIKGYYPNMDHALVEEMLKEKLDDKTFRAVQSILHTQYSGDVGYNPGSQLIQIVGISFLNDLDHYCKEKLKCHYYIRYMDDIVIFCNSREEAKQRMNLIEKFLNKKKFEFNKKKTKIYRLSDCVSFLGFVFRLTTTGKVIMTVKSESIKRERHHLRGLVRASKNGRIPKSQVDKCFEDWLSYANKGFSYHLTQRMRSFYKELWNN